MTRSGIRNLTLIFLVGFALSAILLWVQVRHAQERSMQLQGSLEARRSELNNLNFLVAAQDKLDALTMDERRSTQLDVLKYLGLEKIKLDFRIDSRESRTVGDTNLIVRTVTVQARESYAGLMQLMDRLFASGKFNISGILVQQGEQTVPESASLILQGRLFSLQKQGEIETSETNTESAEINP
jgi:hypothetical protein